MGSAIPLVCERAWLRCCSPSPVGACSSGWGADNSARIGASPQWPAASSARPTSTRNAGKRARAAGLLERMARAPRDALVGIKAAADAARPAARPDLAAAATASFATTWVGDAHWAAVAAMEERRQKSRKNSPSAVDSSAARS